MKNIAVNVVCGVIATGIATAVAFAWNEFLLPMQSVNPPAFWLFTLACVMAGGSIGILIGLNAKKLQTANSVAELEKRPTKEQLDAALAEKDAVIAELRETASLEESHRQFLAMSWHAQVVCLAAFSGSVEKATDGIDDETPNPYRAEARDAGFVLIEACGIGKWRTVPTEKLETLMAEKPEIQQKAWEGVYGDMFEGCDGMPEVDWRDVRLAGEGAVFVPKGTGGDLGQDPKKESPAHLN